MGQLSHKDGGYWDSDVELTARAFAVYVLDKLPNRSDYLAGHAESAVGFDVDSDGNPQIIIAFPRGDERKAINAVFDELIAELKLQNYLTHDEHEQIETEIISQSEPKINAAITQESEPKIEAEITQESKIITPKSSVESTKSSKKQKPELTQLSFFDMRENGAKKPLLEVLEAAKTIASNNENKSNQSREDLRKWNDTCL